MWLGKRYCLSAVRWLPPLVYLLAASISELPNTVELLQIEYSVVITTKYVTERN